MIPLLIQPITFGTLNEKQANAINWTVQQIERGATSATANCSLIWINEDGSTEASGWDFTVDIPNNVLQSWGADDSVIDAVVLAYSPLFQIRNA